MTNHDPARHLRLSDPVGDNGSGHPGLAQIGGLAGTLSPDPLLALLPDGAIIDANDRATEMLNCHGRLLIGAHVGAFLEGLPDGDGKPSIALLLDALAGFDGRPIETVAHKLNGDSVPVEITSLVLHQPEISKPGPAVIVAAIRDITHRKQSERVLTKAKEQAERANFTKLEFLGQLSHELRTPLATVIGFAEVMRDEMFGPIGVKIYRTYAADICKSGRQLTDVVERIIDVTRLEGSMAVAHARTADLAEIVEHVLAAHAGAAAVQGVRMTHTLRRGSMPVVLDDEALEKMIGHVVENAIKYNRFGGKVEIGATIEQAQDGEAAQVVLTVADNGPGFQADQLRRVQSSIDTNQHGTNGGLSLCGAFLHLIGGKLSLSSAPNLGTTATLQFPRRYDGRWHP
ncbi:PAS domain-containing sensor histidine kinase [Dongia rigui]|uniref:histidine kinase n=1 Tax=Dongia rigui TaxID=940149 RepID=A0ABU5E356_9PROT|nr:PAS domain-containing sensor histidine kinase [Dongia rigui]MDY0874022.1 PAS domain-containing sensor histidine kinase [Dongia rigui]